MGALIFVIVIVVGIIGGLITLFVIGYRKQRREREVLQAQLQQEWKGDPNKTYCPVYNIAGINKHGVEPQDCSFSKGWAARDVGNKYDKNAIAIFIGERHIGYLSKEIAKELAPRFEGLENAVPCLLNITSNRDEFKGYYYYVGKVKLLWPDTE